MTLNEMVLVTPTNKNLWDHQVVIIHCKGRTYPVTCHEDTQRGVNVNSTVSNLGVRRKRLVKPMPQPLYLWDRAPVPIPQKSGWAHGAVWMDVEKRKSFVHAGIQTPERPGCSKSLYRVRQPGHFREGRKLKWYKDQNMIL